MENHSLIVDGKEYGFTSKKVHLLWNSDLSNLTVNRHYIEVKLDCNSSTFQGSDITDCLYKVSEYIRKHNHFKDDRYE